MIDRTLVEFALWERMLSAANAVSSGEEFGPENELSWKLGQSVLSYVDEAGENAAHKMAAGLAPVAADLYDLFQPAHRENDNSGGWLSRFVLHLFSISQSPVNAPRLACVLSAAHACGGVDTVPMITGIPDLDCFRAEQRMWHVDSDGISHAVDFDASADDEGFWVVYGYDSEGVSHPVAEVRSGAHLDAKTMADLLVDAL